MLFFYFWMCCAWTAAICYGLFRSGESLQTLAEGADVPVYTVYFAVVAVILLWPLGLLGLICGVGHDSEPGRDK